MPNVGCIVRHAVMSRANCSEPMNHGVCKPIQQGCGDMAKHCALSGSEKDSAPSKIPLHEFTVTSPAFSSASQKTQNRETFLGPSKTWFVFK